MMLDQAPIPEGMKQLGRFCAHVRRAEPVPAELLEHFADAFEDIANGMPPDKALGIAKPRGGQANLDLRKRNYEVELAAAVHIERDKPGRRNIAVCCHDLQDQYPEKASYIQDCYERHRAAGRALLTSFQLQRAGKTLESIAPMVEAKLQGVFSPPKNLAPSK